MLQLGIKKLGGHKVPCIKKKGGESDQEYVKKEHTLRYKPA